MQRERQQEMFEHRRLWIEKMGLDKAKFYEDPGLYQDWRDKFEKRKQQKVDDRKLLAEALVKKEEEEANKAKKEADN